MPLPFRTQRILKVIVDEPRRAKLAEEAAEINKRLDKLRIDETGYKDRLKTVRGDIDSRMEEIGVKLRVVAQGFEEKNVDCEWREHPDRPMKQLVRLDTSEVIEEKPLDPDEAQRRLPGTATAAAGDASTTDEAGTDDAQGAVEATATAAPQPEKPRIQCPFILEQAEDPRQDRLCQETGVARNQGFCKAHHEQLGGNHSPQKVPLVARRSERVRLWRDEQEQKAAELEQAEAQGEA